MVHTLVPSDRVEGTPVYGRSGEKLGCIERLEHELEAKQGDLACKQMLAQRRTLPKS